MKNNKKLITLFLIAGLIGIQFIALIDDPSHLDNPDPNCPLCQIDKTKISIDIEDPIVFNILVISFINDPLPISKYSSPSLSSQSIRAPPLH